MPDGFRQACLRSPTAAVWDPSQSRWSAVRADSLGLERVVVYEFARPDGIGGDRAPATGFTCGMFIGGVPPRGWSEGAPRCGW